MLTIDTVLVEHRVLACRGLWRCVGARRRDWRLVVSLVRASVLFSRCAGRGDATGWLACLAWLGQRSASEELGIDVRRVERSVELSSTARYDL